MTAQLTPEQQATIAALDAIVAKLGAISQPAANPAAGGGNATPKPMPYPSERGAPRFSGEPHLFDAFVENFKSRADLAKIDPKKLKKRICDYVGESERALWMLVPTFSNDAVDFDKFIEEVRVLYVTEIDAIKKFSIDDLHKFLETQRSKRFNNEDEVALYTRDFEAHVLSLNKQGIAHNAQQLYLSAFNDEDRIMITNRLQIKKPDEPYWKQTVPDIATAARYVIQNLRPNSGAGVVAYEPASRGIGQSAPAIKTENLEARVTAVVNQLLGERLGNSTRPSAPPQGPPRFPTSAPYAPPQRSYSQGRVTDDMCLFCWLKGHMMRECQERFNYLKEGKIQVDSTGRMVLPGGLAIPLNRDQSIKSKIDEYWLSQNISDERHLYYEHAIMLYDSIDPATEWEGYEEIRTPEEVDHALYQQALEMVNNFEQTGRTSFPRAKTFDGIELPRRPGPPPARRPPTPYSNNNGNQATASNARTPGIIALPGTAARTTSRPTDDRPQTSAPRREEPRRAEEPENRPAPPKEVERRHTEQTQQAKEREKAKEKAREDEPAAYRNKAPATDEAAPDRIFKQSLDAQVTLPIRDLLGASPDMRRLFQKFTTNRRTPEQVTIINAAQSEDSDDEPQYEDVFRIAAYDHLIARTVNGDLAAHEALPLLSIRVKIGNFDIDTIIDTGATICCISDRVWSMLGESALKEKSITMRDANGNVANTLGAIVDIPVIIGGLTFYLTFHVCKDAPFECILGTPFCAISSIRLVYRPSAEMIAEITDPNTERTVLIPGRAKTRPKDSRSAFLEQVRQDF